MSLSKLQIWIMAARPKTLWAAASPVIIGTAFAASQNSFYLPAALTALFSAIMIQIGTNLANDYFDFTKGSDQPDRLGPTRVTQAGLVTPEAVKRATIIAFGLAFAGGIYLVVRGGWPIALIGLLSIFLGVLYTAGPRSLSYTGLADIFVLIFFGPVAVAGTAYVQTLEISTAAIFAGFAPGLISTAILAVNNLRDIESDRRANKKTLAVRFGLSFAKAEYVTTMMLGSLWPLFFLYRNDSHPWTLLASLAIIPTIPLIAKVNRLTGKPLNDILASSGKVLLLYSLLYSIGLLV